MKKLASIILLAAYVALGTGTLQHLHNLQHEAEDAREDAALVAAGKIATEHHHDESNCPTHAELFLAFFFAGPVQLLLTIGGLIAVLSAVSRRGTFFRIWDRVDCRGPPGNSLLCH